MRVDDVIVCVAGKPFIDRARKSIVLAIQNAEKESGGGKLQLGLVRAPSTGMRVMHLVSLARPGCDMLA